MDRKYFEPPSTRRGMFISFEGTDGSGKTTQAKMLSAHLLKNGMDVLLTHEPGGTRVGQRIRDILLDPALREMTPMAETILFAADRAQHVAEVIRPAINAGKVVICDRFIDSSLAYQGVARGLGLEGVRNLNEWATADLYPSITFLLRLPFEDGLDRLSDVEKDRMEMSSAAFHSTVQDAYITLAKFFSQRMIVLNGALSPDAIHQNVMGEVEKHLL